MNYLLRLAGGLSVLLGGVAASSKYRTSVENRYKSTMEKYAFEPQVDQKDPSLLVQTLAAQFKELSFHIEVEGYHHQIVEVPNVVKEVFQRALTGVCISDVYLSDEAISIVTSSRDVSMEFLYTQDKWHLYKNRYPIEDGEALQTYQEMLQVLDNQIAESKEEDV